MFAAATVYRTGDSTAVIVVVPVVPEVPATLRDDHRTTTVRLETALGFELLSHVGQSSVPSIEPHHARGFSTQHTKRVRVHISTWP